MRQRDDDDLQLLQNVFQTDLVDTPLVRQVEAVLGGGESLHLQDAGSDGHSGEVDLGTGLLKAHRGVHGRERDATVPWGKERGGW